MMELRAVHRALLKLDGDPEAGEIYQWQKATETLAKYQCRDDVNPVVTDALRNNVTAFEVVLIDMAAERIA